MKDLFELISIILFIACIVVCVKWCDKPDKGLKSAITSTWNGDKK